MKSRFHDEALRMLGLDYRVDSIAQVALESRAKTLGIKLPGAFAEWYAMQDGIAVLGKHSNCDHPAEIEQLGDARLAEQLKEPSDQILPFMVENQGVSLWGLRLDAGDDPPVMVAVDPHFKWRPHADQFSTFMNCQIWDHAKVFGGLVVAAQANPLAGRDVEALRAHLPELSSTRGWPGEQTYRFEREEDRVLIWNGESQADWWISSSDEEALGRLLRELLSYCRIEGFLYGTQDEAQRVVDSIRRS